MLQLGGAKSNMSFSSRAAAGGVAKAGLLLGVTGVMFRQVPQPNTLATLANASMLDVFQVSAQNMLKQLTIPRRRRGGPLKPEPIATLRCH